ncbi:unnamed protein product [Urochloa humidicola]
MASTKMAAGSFSPISSPQSCDSHPRPYPAAHWERCAHPPLRRSAHRAARQRREHRRHNDSGDPPVAPLVNAGSDSGDPPVALLVHAGSATTTLDRIQMSTTNHGQKNKAQLAPTVFHQGHSRPG